ncbi:lipid A biosynthesis acyltransferase [Polluticoccus soli]|uniref:LpxL/LpxP family acyltransferase n=1 Tax=Polluticoccus soli TaxID=3034150 RepID=UPI0023E16D03|nr:lipid A biosynthesis acyltransferase [Flavipsychrobacter sp. JY13-12]
MPSWEGRSRGTTLGYSIFIWLLKKGGLKPAYALLHLVTPYYRLFVPNATKPLRYLYEQRLGFSKRVANKLIKKNLIIFGQTIIDKVAILSGINPFEHINFEGTDKIAAMLEAGNGGLVVSAHLGNWEVAGHMLKRMNTKVNILMYDGEGEEMKQYMEQYDNKRSFNIIYIKNDLSHIYEMSAALRRNELICLHADRFRPGNRTMEHEFLGEKALFPAGAFILASKLKVPVCFVFGFKEGNFRYRYYSYPAKTYEGKGTTGMEAMLHDYVNILEEKVKQYPDQWFNYYDFWKHD